MSNTVSPNMGLVIPTVGAESGPTYADDINASLTIVDQHTHLPGSGVLITPAAISINSSLTFANNFATDLAGLTLTAQGSTPSALGTVYRSSNDLYYVDGAGNNVRITQSGAVAGTPGSIANLAPPASVTYVAASSTFVFESDTSIAGNLDLGALLLRNLSPNSTYAVTLRPPAALAANSTITLPAVPGATGFVTLDSSGNMAATVSTSGGLTGSNIANTNSITADQVSLSYKQPMKQIFTGSGTFTAPAGTSSATVYKVTVVGGGGSGGSVSGSCGGGGGGGGGTAIGWVTGIAAAGTVAVTVGAGGVGVVSGGTAGHAGGTSSFGSSVIATGGAAGAGGSISSTTIRGGIGGFGTTGDIFLGGNTGGTGFNVSGIANVGGDGGSSSVSGGGRGGSGVNTAQAGNRGGGGGGGTDVTASGAGGAGLVVVEWVQ